MNMGKVSEFPEFITQESFPLAYTKFQLITVPPHHFMYVALSLRPFFLPSLSLTLIQRHFLFLYAPVSLLIFSYGCWQSLLPCGLFFVGLLITSKEKKFLPVIGQVLFLFSIPPNCLILFFLIILILLEGSHFLTHNIKERE